MPDFSGFGNSMNDSVFGQNEPSVADFSGFMNGNSRGEFDVVNDEVADFSGFWWEPVEGVSGMPVENTGDVSDLSVSQECTLSWMRAVSEELMNGGMKSEGSERKSMKEFCREMGELVMRAKSMVDEMINSDDETDRTTDEQPRLIATRSQGPVEECEWVQKGAIEHKWYREE